MRLVIASLGVLVLAPGVGDAQDLAAEGAFTINFTSTVINGEPSISIGPDHKKGLYEGVLTASNAAGTGLLHQLTGRCVGIWEIDTKAGTFEQHGNCVYTNPEGDEILGAGRVPVPAALPGPDRRRQVDRRQRQVRRYPRRVRDPRPPSAAGASRLRPGHRVETGQLQDRRA